MLLAIKATIQPTTRVITARMILITGLLGLIPKLLRKSEGGVACATRIGRFVCAGISGEIDIDQHIRATLCKVSLILLP
jgi:hypothetical protein